MLLWNERFCSKVLGKKGGEKKILSRFVKADTQVRISHEP